VTLLTANDRTRLTADWSAMFPTTGDVLRVTGTSDGIGGRSTTWASIYHGPCRIAPSRGDVAEAQDGGRMRDEMLFRIAFPAGTDVTFADRVRIGTETYSINSVREPHSLEMERVVFGERAPK
jgi:hypothetical protein